jgi:ABC-type multidrug transport system ATPase subunit
LHGRVSPPPPTVPSLFLYGAGMNAPTRSDILHVQDLTFAYPGQPPLVSGWCASIGPGVTLLHGDMGSGKSTLLRLMAGTLVPAAGRLTIGSAALADDPEAYRRQVFFCDAASADFDRQTARECTDLLSAGDTQFDDTEWRRLVEGFALAAHLDKPLYMLSTGSKRKVWLAAALASGRALVLLDEPTGALDAASVACLWRTLAAQATRAQRAVVVASAERIDTLPLAASIDLPAR